MTFWSHLDLACTCLINVNVKKKTATIDTSAKMPLWNEFVRSLSKKQNNSGKSDFFYNQKPIMDLTPRIEKRGISFQFVQKYFASCQVKLFKLSMKHTQGVDDKVPKILAPLQNKPNAK